MVERRLAEKIESLTGISSESLWESIGEEIDAISGSKQREVVSDHKAIIVITGENNADANLGVIYSQEPKEVERSLLLFKEKLEIAQLPADVQVTLPPEHLRNVAARTGFSILNENVPHMLLIPSQLDTTSNSIPSTCHIKELQPTAGIPSPELLAVDQIQAQAFHYDKGAVIRMMGDTLGWEKGARVYLMEDEGVPVSTVTTVFNEKTKVAGIWSMASVQKSKGYGKILLNHLLANHLHQASIVHVLPFPGVEGFYRKVRFEDYDTFSTVEYTPRRD